MTAREQILECMLNRNYDNFVHTASSLVIKLNGVDELYLMATNKVRVKSKKEQQALLFRSAYTLEYIYFKYTSLFAPFVERFIVDYSHCNNHSAKRHFTKMMADILKSHKPTPEQCEVIAYTTVSWIIEPKAKVAVKIWAMSLLKILKPDIVWLNETWEDLEESMKNGATAGVLVRAKRNWM